METSNQPNAANGRSEDPVKTMGQRASSVSDSAQQAWDRTRDAVTDLKRAADIDGRVRRNPYGTVAAALGIGYVLGGGIFTPLTGRIVGLGLRLGIRLALLPMMKDQISELADSLGGEIETNKGRRGGGKAAKTSER
ncbi:MAG TPA: hypothetical protein VN962_23420 [Polyangia bacterium]|jgi:hypothetical protein|nr:hypothetical protein [Polyangia bacterium]